SMYLSIVLRPPCSPLFPYTTLFRSKAGNVGGVQRHLLARAARQIERAGVVRARAGEGVDRDTHLGEHVRPVVRGSHGDGRPRARDRKSTRLNSSHVKISYAVFCLKK